MKKYENLKMDFSKKGPKMPMGRVPIEIFGVSKLFYRKFVKKHFRGRGPQKSMISGFFSKSDSRNFCQLGKTCFLSCRFFEKSRKWRLFLGVRVRPKMFFANLY